MSDAEVERVAKAMWEASRRYWVRRGMPGPNRWDEQSEGWLKDDARVQARAAIKALQKKPTRGKAKPQE